MHPDILHIGSITIHSYGMMIVLAIVCCAIVSRKVSAQYGISFDDIVDVMSLGIVLSLIGARLLYVALNWSSEFAGNPISALKVWEGGLSFHGSLAGAILAVVVMCRVRKKTFYSYVDCMAPGFAFGYAIGRIGCFLNGCCYGKACSAEWGMHFQGTEGYHIPTQLYSSLFGVLIGSILLYVQTIRPKQGVVFYLFLFLYSLYRFIIEYWRAGATAVVTFDNLTQAQWLSVVMMVVFGVICFKIWKGKSVA